MRFMELELLMPIGALNANVMEDDDEGIRILSVREGGNGEKAGLLAKDSILSLNGISTRNMSTQEFIRMVKEDEFDKVKQLVVRREVKEQPITGEHATASEDGLMESQNDSATVEHQAKKQKITTDESSTLKKCDICTKPDHEYNTCLQTCASCNVSVHETCYGLVNTYESKRYKHWRCHACASVGQSVIVKLEAKNDTAGTKCITIDTTKRPHKCELCSISTGFHAMHPLFTTHGSDGRPVIRSVGGVYQMAWVHTLCALVLAANKFSAGLLYGCDEEGIYECVEDEERHDDEESGDPHVQLSYFENDEELLTPNPHHFVITNENTESIDFLKRLEEFRTLTCYICKVKPKDQKRRIPLQCSYGDCQTSFHVGCARWGTSENRILFSPVEAEDIDNHLAEGYCGKHYKTTKNQIRGVDEGSSSEEGEMVDIDVDFTDDDSVSTFEDEVLIPSTIDNEVYPKTKSFNEPKMMNTSKYNERKKMIEKAFGEVSKASDEKDMQHLMAHWKDQLGKLDFKKLQQRVQNKLVATNIENKSDEEDLTSSKEKYTPSPWDNMFLPNYVRGSINFDSWDRYEEISESEMTKPL